MQRNFTEIFKHFYIPLPMYGTESTPLQKRVQSFTRIFVILKSFKQLNDDYSFFWNQPQNARIWHSSFYCNLGST